MTRRSWSASHQAYPCSKDLQRSNKDLNFSKVAKKQGGVLFSNPFSSSFQQLFHPLSLRPSKGSLSWHSGLNLADSITSGTTEIQDTVMCSVQGAEVRGHRQEQLMQTMIVYVFKTHLFWLIQKFGREAPCRLFQFSLDGFGFFVGLVVPEINRRKLLLSKKCLYLRNRLPYEADRKIKADIQLN